MKTKVEIRTIPKETSLLDDGDLFYRPGSDDVYRLTYEANRGLWSSLAIARAEGWRVSAQTADEALAGLAPVPPGSVITIRVEES